MDLLFKEYADPFSLLDTVIPNRMFVDFLTTFYEKHDERLLWEIYLHKLSVWDQRSWEEFKHDMKFGTAPQEQQIPSDQEIEGIVKNSYAILKDFRIKGG